GRTSSRLVLKIGPHSAGIEESLVGSKRLTEERRSFLDADLSLQFHPCVTQPAVLGRIVILGQHIIRYLLNVTDLQPACPATIKFLALVGVTNPANVTSAEFN